MLKNQINQFFQSLEYAVIGASSNRDKYGNKVLRCFIKHNKITYPVNPREEIIEGLQVIHSISNLPLEVKSISIITPPHITETIVVEAINKGIKNIWMQPGSESNKAIEICKKHQLNLITGSCILVLMDNNY